MVFRRVFLILADGTRPDVFDRLIQDGRLPHTARLFPDQSMRRTATSVFPSTTGPAFLPFLTGCFPGTTDMPGIRWFDRSAYVLRNGRPKQRSYVGLESYRMNSDLRPGIATLFDIFPRSVSMYSAINRGVSWSRNLTKVSRAVLWVYAHETDRWDTVHMRVRKRLLRALDTDPDFVFCVVPDADCLAHLSHPQSDPVLDAYGRLDETIGLLTSELERRGWRDESVVMIVSDHGQSAVHTHLGLPEWMRDGLGYDPFYYPRVWKRRFDSVVSISGNGMAHIDVRRGSAWGVEKATDEYLARHHTHLMHALVERPEVALVATRSERGPVIVRSKDGMARIDETKDSKIDYSVLTSDPLGYDGIDGPMTADESLAATFDTKYPDGPVQLNQLFKSGRTGDIVVSAEIGFDLRDKHERPEHKSGHGALHAEHMLVPWFSSVPLPDAPLRTVDVYTAILALTGRRPPSKTDGRRLLNVSREEPVAI